LAAFARPGQAVTFLDDATSGIVLGSDHGTVTVLIDGQEYTERGTRRVRPVDDPHTLRDLTGQLVTWAVATQARLRARVIDVQDDASTVSVRLTDRLVQIRAHLIARHRAGHLSRQLLDDLLTEVGMAPYHSVDLAQCTVTGRVEGSDSATTTQIRRDTQCRPENPHDVVVAVPGVADLCGSGDGTEVTR